MANIYLCLCKKQIILIWSLCPSWSCSYGSWINNYLCNQCLSPLTLWVRIPFRRCVLDTALCVKMCRLLATSRWFSPGTQVFSTNKTDCQDLAEILFKVALNTIKQTNNQTVQERCTRYSIIWQSLSVTCYKSVVFCGYSCFLHQ